MPSQSKSDKAAAGRLASAGVAATEAVQLGAAATQQNIGARAPRTPLLFVDIILFCHQIIFLVLHHHHLHTFAHPRDSSRTFIIVEVLLCLRHIMVSETCRLYGSRLYGRSMLASQWWLTIITRMPFPLLSSALMWHAARLADFERQFLATEFVLLLIPELARQHLGTYLLCDIVCPARAQPPALIRHAS